MQRRGRLTLLPLFLVGLFVAYQYFSAEKVTNPETGRSARVALSSDQEKALGLQAYREVLSQVQTVSSGSEYELVRRVASRLGPATGEAAKDFEWAVSLVRSDEVNAFCLPGGKIVIYTGILRIAQTEAGLAAVMGHEMAHAVARHGSQRLLRDNLTQSVLVGVSLSLGDMDYQQRQMVMAALGAGATYGLILPFSRDHETEADQMGLLYMARAGYDPAEAISFWERMGESGGARPPEFASTHPSHASRIADLRAFLPKAREEYERSSASRPAIER
jgi:predicted Zn-dependent protease